jgi:hypothetical protein
MLNKNDLKQKPNEEIRRLLMSFTRVSCSVKKERKNSVLISNSQQQKNSKKKMKKATKSKQKGICSLEGRMSKFSGKKELTHREAQQVKHRDWTLKKQFWKGFLPKEG